MFNEYGACDKPVKTMKRKRITGIDVVNGAVVEAGSPVGDSDAV